VNGELERVVALLSPTVSSTGFRLAKVIDQGG